MQYVRDNAPVAYFVYRRASKEATLLFLDKPELEKYQLSERKGVLIPARDGQMIPAYLSLPVRILVLLPGAPPHTAWPAQTQGWRIAVELQSLTS